MHPLTPIFPTELPTRTETLLNGYSFRMVRIPAGRFEMGSDQDEEDREYFERPRHWVHVPTFELAEFPVTQELWRLVRFILTKDLTPLFALHQDNSFFRGSALPVNRVSWMDATNFCQAISIVTDRTYRLPTEAEWEYAARCGQRKTLYAGSHQLEEVGWYRDNNGTETMPVGLLGPNDWGLYDMSGNVWEWCADHWHENYRGAPKDGTVWLTDDEFGDRLSRGGSWRDFAWSCRVACRHKVNPAIGLNDQSLRLAVSP